MQDKFRIYIIQMHTNTLPARLIRMFTRYEYSHIAISLDRSCNMIYSFGRKKVNNFLNGGFVVQERQGEFFKKFKNTKCRIYELEVRDEQYNSVESKLYEMEQRSDEYKYDFWGIVARLLKIPVTFKNKYVCSYFVAELLEISGICTFGKQVCMVVPKDFEKIKGAKEIYTGKYSEYKMN